MHFEGDFMLEAQVCERVEMPISNVHYFTVANMVFDVENENTPISEHTNGLLPCSAMELSVV
jgi:hypothetical protein